VFHTQEGRIELWLRRGVCKVQQLGTVTVEACAWALFEPFAARPHLVCDPRWGWFRSLCGMVAGHARLGTVSVSGIRWDAAETHQGVSCAASLASRRWCILHCFSVDDCFQPRSLRCLIVVERVHAVALVARPHLRCMMHSIKRWIHQMEVVGLG